MLSPAMVRVLACPVCHSSLSSMPGRLVCSAGHHFDLSRDGHVHLGRGRISSGDTASMVQARLRFLARGHFAPLADTLASIVATRPPKLIVDVGAGPGYYLASVVERMPGTSAIAIDVSRFAARHAARAHPRVGSVIAEHRALPLRSGAIDVVTCVFAPRDPRELHRVLQACGRCLVVTPAPAHLGELRRRHGGLEIEPNKRDRLLRTFAPWFELVRTTELELALCLSPDDIADVLAMGPAAFHPDRIVGPATEPLCTIAAFSIYELAPRPGGEAPAGTRLEPV